MSRLVVVGSGTVVPEPDRRGSCYWMEMGATRALLDCGPGVLQGLTRCGLAWATTTDLVLTHFHADHVGGVPGYFFALKHGLLPERREAPLVVRGPPGTRRLFDRLAEALGDYLLTPEYPIRIEELGPGDAAELSGGVTVRAHATPHTEESQAVRIDGPASVGYTGDTGPSESLGRFMRGVDLLVCECSLPDEEVGDNHLSPSGVAALAGAARPGRLVLTHVYPHLRELDAVELVRRAGYDGAIELAWDGLAIDLTG